MKLTHLCAVLTLLTLTPIVGAGSLEKEMKSIGRNMKALSQQIEDASKKDSSLKLIADLKQAAEKSKQLNPSKTKELPAADQAKFVADYREAMAKLVVEYERIEDALKANKFDQAKTVFAGLKEIKRDGHERFASEE